ncbi:efflux RND transporter periplasmic adaptor subunit [Cytophagaceae bacterium ABcell3]|nr:efflux RND transporter periplasmic adaptor subunit [Cytophagaceae bacterium ABcell3]
MLLIAFVGFFSCQPQKEQEKEETKEQVVPVEVMPVRKENMPFQSVFTSTLNAWERRNIAAQSAGIIERIFVWEGDKVKKGQVLVQMNDASLNQSLVQLRAAEKNLRRMDTLYREGAISLQQFENARDQFENARTNHNLTSRNTQLKAPFDGTITARFMNEGEVFTMSPVATGVPAILTLQQIDQLKATVNVSERLYPQLKRGQRAVIRSDVYPDKTFKGEVSNIFPVVDPSTRTFTVEIKVDNKDELLKPGMFARITLDLDENHTLMVPRSAIIRQPGTQRFYGFIIDNGQAVRKTITTGKSFNEWVEVLDGLSEGDTLVTTGQGRLHSGTPVNVVSQFKAESVNE